MNTRWRRSDFNPGDILRDHNGLLWKVVGIADEPTLEIVTIDKLMPERENHVISSLLFAERFPEKLESRSLTRERGNA